MLGLWCFKGEVANGHDAIVNVNLMEQRAHGVFVGGVDPVYLSLAEIVGLLNCRVVLLKVR